MDIRRRGFLSTLYKSSSPTSRGSYTINLKDKWRLSSTIPNPDSSKYDGVYESFSNYNVGSTGATMTITITGYTTFRLYIRSYAESNYDYVMVSQLDLGIDNNTSYSNTTLVKAHTRGNLKSGTAIGDYTLVEYTNIDGGTHDINITYRKDSSVNTGDDRGYLLIERGSSEIETPGEDIEEDYVITYTSTDGNIVTPYSSNGFGTTLVSNTYEDVGIMLFNGPITTIGDYAFDGCTGLASITIPYSVTSIGNSAFRDCSSLTSVTIPNSVTIIEYQAFYSCDSLANVTIGDGVTSIGNYTFCNCSDLTSVIIPNSVTSIGGSAFQYCSGLTSVTIPNSVTSIGSSAFSGCSGLKEVHINDIAAWCNISFGNYNANPVYYTKKLYLNGALIKDLIIPNSVISIGDYTFYSCRELTSVTIGNGVTTIGLSAFQDCPNLNSVTVGKNIKNSEKDSFYLDSYINSVFIEDLNEWFNITFGNAYANPLCYHATLYLNNIELTTLIIPEGMVKINDFAFYGCGSITDILFPTTLSSIGCNAFDETLWYNTQPDGLLYINNILYKYKGTMPSNTSLNIDSTVKAIAGGAFTSQTNLISVTLPNTIAVIEKRTFAGCTNLSSVTLPNSIISIDTSAFSSCKYLRSFVVPDSVESIGDSAFSMCTYLRQITIGKNVKNIGNSAFNTFSTDGTSPILYFRSSTPPTCNPNKLGNSNAYNGDIYVPTGATSAYKAAGWGSVAGGLIYEYAVN